MKNVIITLGLLMVPLISGTITKTFNFSLSDFVFKKNDGYDLIILSDESETREIGAPLLPRKIVNFLIPPNAEITKVVVISKREIEIPGFYRIYPCQKPFPFSHPEIAEFFPPDAYIYSSSDAYPAMDIEFYPAGKKSGYRIAGIAIYPLKYIPAQGKLLLTTSITIQLEYTQRENNVILLTEKQCQIFSREIRSLVINPEDIARFSPPSKRNLNSIEYVIITNDYLASAFQPLADWRTKQGWKAEVKTTSWIYANYSGYDNEERIRNFIKDYFANKGLIWVLIGGDADIVPVRLTYLPEAHSPYSDWLSSDLYYADLDGTWDANNNHIYGEFTGDSVDLYADIFVGRIPVDNTTNVFNYISKQNTYEKNPPTIYLRKMLLPSVMLVPLLSYHGRVVNNAIADITPADWLNAKIEDPMNGVTRDSLSTGYQFCHIASHGDYDGFYYYNSNPVFTIGEVASLNNDTKYNIINSIACLTGNFDEFDCVAESLINKYPGACVAAILNTRLGFGQRGCLGPSELLDLSFYERFFNEDLIEIGTCHYRSKEVYRNDILTEPHWRYCGYELTLFGDPALPMWQERPRTMNVNHPGLVSMGTNYFEVMVKENNNITPITNALVGLKGKADTCLYGVGYTNTSGIASILIHPGIPRDTMWVTVTAQNRYPYEGFAIIDSDMCTMPTIIRPLNYARLSDLQPALTFYSTDPQGNDIQYRILWDSNPNFSAPESVTTVTYSSGDTVNFIFPSPLIDGETYWWRVKAIDPAGSSYWTQYTPKRSFTINSDMPPNTCSWFQTIGAQFSVNNFSGTMIQGDSVILVPYGQTIFDTILKEDFEAGGIPPNWTVVDGNSDSLDWTVGRTRYLAPFWHPPNFGSRYAFFAGDTGNTMTNNEELISPSIYTFGITSGLQLIYSYTWLPKDYGDYRLKMRKKIGGSWSSWFDIKVYSETGLGVETINLTSYLPADSIQFDWFYKDNSTPWLSGVCACDNVVLHYPYTPVNNYGAMTGSAVNYHDLSLTYPRNHWGDVVWHKSTVEDSIGIQVEYFDGTHWQLVPDAQLPGNSTGFFGSLVIDTISINSLDTLTYHTLRLKALFYRNVRAPDEPALLAWEIGNLSNYGIEEYKSPRAESPKMEIYPNPFHNKTTIKFEIRNPKSEMSLRIYDASGRLVRQWDYETIRQSDKIIWDGSDDAGHQVSAGVYFVRLESEDYKQVEKILLLH